MAEFLIIAMVLESAHLISPILAAWSRRELRALALREWGVFIVWPAAVIVGVLLAPPKQVFGLYWAWNSYHYGMQNFGLLQLHRQGGSADRRVLEGLLCLSISAIGFGWFSFVFPLTSLPGMLIVLVFSLDHWLCDITLSSRISRWQWGFIATVIACGIAWLECKVHWQLHTVTQVATLRNGVGMIHFIYSARIWKLSDPKIRAAIGSSLA